MDIKALLSIGITILLLVTLIVLLVMRAIKEKNVEKLKCASCGEASCIVISQNRLGHICIGCNLEESGYLNTFMLPLSETAIEDWIIGKQDMYSCCKKCGYFEKLRK